MPSGQTIRKDASPNSKKNRWHRIQEIHNDCDKLDYMIQSRRYGAQGTLALISLQKVLKRTIYQLEKGGL